MKKHTKLKISLCILTIVIISILCFVGNYFYNICLNPTIADDSPTIVSADVDSNAKWLLDESNYSDEYITSFDDLKLHAYKILNPTPTNKWVISVHGYLSEAFNMRSYAKVFDEMGYNILLPDLKSHGLSEGDYVGMGWNDRLDILAWIDTIITENPDAEIILHGVSMGAATVTSVSGEKLPSNIKAIIADCGYTTAWDEFSHQLDSQYSLPEFPVLHAANLVCKLRAGYWFTDASPIEQVVNSETPILFIHGDNDDYVPYTMMEELFNTATCDKEMITIENADHANSNVTNPEKYWTSVYAFINKHISQ